MSGASNATMRVLVVDDEPLAARRLARALAQQPDVEVVGIHHDGAGALRALEAAACDVVFLDIRMPGVDGFEVARALTGPGCPLVVFVTAYSKFAADAFGVEAVDYLLKPVESDRLRAALERLRHRLAASRAAAELAQLRLALADGGSDERQTSDFEIWAPTTNGAVRVFLDQIDWLAAEGDYVRLHLGDRTYLMRMTLQDLVARVGQGRFVRVHRGAAVNLDRVRSVVRLPHRALNVTLTSGAEVRVSRSHAPSLKRRLRTPEAPHASAR